MELRQLRYFLAVAEELHFGRAAERLRVSQPPLSVAIKALEREIGAPLFRRTTRRVELTAEGEHLRDRLGPLVAGIDEAVRELGDVRSGIRGRLRVGYVSSASYSILPGAVRAFQERRPHVELRLQPLTSAEQLGRLLDDELDVGILRDQPPVPGVTQELVRSERLVAVLPAGHPLAAPEHEHDGLAPEALDDEPLVLFPYDLMPGYLARVTGVLEQAGARVRIVQRTVHQETVLGLVAAGVGLSILPESVAAIRMPGVVSRPLAVDPRTELTIAWHGVPGAAARVFAECAHAAGGGTGEAAGRATR